MNQELHNLRLECYLVNQNGSRINFYNPKNLELCGYQSLPPKEVFTSNTSHECKNCQVSAKEIAIGDSEGRIIIKNLIDSSCKPLNADKTVQDDELIPDDVENIKIVMTRNNKGSSKGRVRCLSSSYTVFNSDKFLLSCGEGFNCRVWNLEERKEIKRFSIGRRENYCMFLNSKMFASCGTDSKTKIYDFEKMSVLQSFSDTIDWLNELCYSKAHDLVYSGASDRTVNVYCMKEMRKVCKMKYEEWISCLCVIDRKNTLVFGDREGVLYFVDNRKINETNKFRSYKKIGGERPCRLRKILDNESNLANTIITGAEDFKIRLLEIDGHRRCNQLRESKEEIAVWGLFYFQSGISHEALQDLKERIEFFEDSDGLFDVVEKQKIQIDEREPIVVFKILLCSQ